MDIWYSPKKNSFFSKMVTPSFFKSGKPIEPISDAVAITTERHKELMDELRNGRVLTSVETDQGLRPVTVEMQKKDETLTIKSVKEVRQRLYKNLVDPLSNEARMERLSGNEQEAIRLESLAVTEYKKIKMENPLPEPN